MSESETLVAPRGWLARWGGWLWPTSLRGQVMLALAFALLLAQAIGAALLYRAQAAAREEQVTHALAIKLVMAARGDVPPPPQAQTPMDQGGHQSTRPGPGPEDVSRGPRTESVPDFSLQSFDRVLPETARRLALMLADQDVSAAGILVCERPILSDPMIQQRLARRAALLDRHVKLNHPPPPHDAKLLIAALPRRDGNGWLVARVVVGPDDPRLLATLILQTLLIYAVLVGTMAFILRRIIGPLAALTAQVEQFAETRDATNQVQPQGPQDMRRLIAAQNAMENRIIALINEKDVMLGAIGHDLKTPLSALRVRIECVEDDNERARMAQTIEEITRSLDDILSLARVGRPSDPLEVTELSALVASVSEDYEDMGEPVELGETQRVALPLRALWIRRALHNLIGNAVRYGSVAHVSLAREEDAHGAGWAVIRVEDQGPGIAESQIARMFEPFTRGEPSRNTHTGGAGLGLTLARAIAEQHGGTLELANHIGPDGGITGLVAVLRLPLA
ncbi:MAG: HAMP domain-containing histidine kinase [Sphingomonadales bacterium]|nr:HAMP domain-containing histidine kinase [Sphingomonadales bacterium]MDE2168735.1 HAMP domain-containing histidine kinase [Sphingomonadales bacterium]